jgi:hypothetical protein
MRAEMLAVEHRLGELHMQLKNNPLLVSTVAVEATRLTNKLKQIKNTATYVADDYGALLKLEAQLRHEANIFRAALDDMAEQFLFPIAWGMSSAISRAALRLVHDGSGQQGLTSHDQIKRRLGLIKSMLGDVQQGISNLGQIRAQRENLVQLLTTPELAENPTWLQAIKQLTQRKLAQRPDHPAAVELNTRATAIQERRKQFFTGLPESPHGSSILPEEKLPQLLSEAHALQQAVRRLWVDARALAGK